MAAWFRPGRASMGDRTRHGISDLPGPAPEPVGEGLGQAGCRGDARPGQRSGPGMAPDLETGLYEGDLNDAEGGPPSGTHAW